MHYIKIYGTYQKILPYEKSLQKIYKTSLLQSCKEFGENAFWIVILDALNNVVCSCTLGKQNDTFLQVYNIFLSQEYKNTRFIQYILSLCKKYTTRLKMHLFGYVHKNNSKLIQVYEELDGYNTELFYKENYLAYILP